MRFLPSLLASLAILTGLSIAGDKAPAKGPVIHLDAPATAKLLEEKAAGKRPVIIDIRTLAEFEDGHLEGARQIDFLRDDFEEKIAKLDRATPYLIHCRSGGRSGRSLATWKKLGFKRIYHLDGGMNAWRKAGLPVVK